MKEWRCECTSHVLWSPFHVSREYLLLYQAEATRTLKESYGLDHYETDFKRKPSDKARTGRGSMLSVSGTRIGRGDGSGAGSEDEEWWADRVPDRTIEGTTRLRGFMGGVTPSSFLQCLRGAGVGPCPHPWSLDILYLISNLILPIHSAGPDIL